MAIMTIPCPLHISFDELGRICAADDRANGEPVERTAEYLEKCSQSFGTVISKDIEFCTRQSVFCQYAKISERDGITAVDVSEVPAQGGNEFYISSKESIESWIGCEVYDYETKDSFFTYRVKPLRNIMKFDNV